MDGWIGYAAEFRPKTMLTFRVIDLDLSTSKMQRGDTRRTIDEHFGLHLK